MQAQQTERSKSLTLSKQTRKDFKKWADKFPSRQKAANAVGFKKGWTVTEIISKGTCASESLEKINAVLGIENTPSA